MTANGQKPENKTGGMVQSLRASAQSALRRLSGRPETSPPPAASAAFSFRDPTKALFPGDSTEDDSPSGPPLSALLEDSAHAMARRKEELREPARRLAETIHERREGEVTLAVQAIRVAIGLVWFGVAVWLYVAVLNARADDLTEISIGAPLDDAAVLMRTFMVVALAGLGVAFGVAALTKGLGNADNGRITAEAEKLGGAIADVAREFDSDLTALRSAMDRRGHPADAVDDLSRAHLTALEAHDFFREISFLTGGEDDHAQRMFRGFLARASGSAAGPSFLLIFLIGALSGAMAVYFTAVPRPEPTPGATGAALAIMQYPWAAKLILVGGLAYASAGALLSFFASSLTEGVARKARADALTALRSGFASGSALRPADVTRRIKDAVDVFRARVGGGGKRMAAKPEETNHSAGFSTDEELPEWRRRDSSVKFVDTGFTAAPESWRTDAFAKKFEGEKAPGTGAKRGGKAFKNRFSD